MDGEIKLTPNLEKLIAERLAATTERQRTACEDRIIRELPRGMMSSLGLLRVKVIMSLLGCKADEEAYLFDCRARLHDAPAALWDYAEQKRLPIGSIVRLNQKARSRSRAGQISMDKAAIEILTEMKAKEAAKRSGHGPIDLRGVFDGEVGKRKSRSYWRSIRTTVEGMVLTTASDLPLADRKELHEWLLQELGRLASEFSSKTDIRRKRANGEGNVITRRMVLDACERLHMNPPAPGCPVDLRQAKRQMRTLVRLEHPDTGSGDTESLNEILHAYTTLDEYNKQLSKGKS